MDLSCICALRYEGHVPDRWFMMYKTAVPYFVNPMFASTKLNNGIQRLKLLITLSCLLFPRLGPTFPSKPSYW
jgi:hypothetical protein